MTYDHATSLIWEQAGSKKTLGWKESKAYVAKLNQKKFAGYCDWRLPTLEKGMSLIEREMKNGDLYIDPVFDKAQRWIWTTDPVNNSAYGAWYVVFSSGGYCSRSHVNNDRSYYVRAVRSAA